MPKFRVVVAYKARVVYEIEAENAEAAENAAEARWRGTSVDQVILEGVELDFIGAADLVDGDRRGNDP